MTTECSSKHSQVHDITSKPPASAIELKAPATAHEEEGATVTFPVGKYKPSYEDEHGYYYEAPEKVLVDDVAVYGFDGGLYLSRDKHEVTGWYLIRPNGRRTSGHFKNLPHYKVIP